MLSPASVMLGLPTEEVGVGRREPFANLIRKPPAFLLIALTLFSSLVVGTELADVRLTSFAVKTKPRSIVPVSSAKRLSLVKEDVKAAESITTVGEDIEAPEVQSRRELKAR